VLSVGSNARPEQDALNLFDDRPNTRRNVLRQ
jgi:hypothetical protein